MRWALLLAIRLYWAWPARWRRCCLYRESCSRHVYRITRTRGLAAGMRALAARYRTCRPGYGVVWVEGSAWVLLADGSLLAGDQAAPAILCIGPVTA